MKVLGVSSWQVFPAAAGTLQGKGEMGALDGIPFAQGCQKLNLGVRTHHFLGTSEVRDVGSG